MMMISVKHPLFCHPPRALGICYVTWSVVFEAHQKLNLLSSLSLLLLLRETAFSLAVLCLKKMQVRPSVRRPPRIDCGLLQVGIAVLEMTYEVNCICHGASIGD